MKLITLYMVPVIMSTFTTDWKGIGRSDALWAGVEPISFEKPSESDNLVRVKSLWDKDSLYLRFDVKDKELRAIRDEMDHPCLYLDDMVEVLIDAFNDKNECWAADDIVYHINLLAQKKDDRGTADCSSDPDWNGNARFAVALSGTLNDSTDTDEGYRVEIAFPWHELQVSPETGKKVGINFANGDNDGNGRQLFDWSGAWPLRTPSKFGTLVLKDAWEGFPVDSVISPMDGYVNRFHYYKSTSLRKEPLIVSIHQWSADYTNFRNSMAPQARAKNWNFIFPDARGANNHPKACGSDYVVADIDQAIEWAVRHLPVDTSRIYIVGASGGGYNALCHFMKSRRPVKAYSVWVPITDLDRWHKESLERGNRYARDIEKCVCDTCARFSKELADKRSPLYMPVPVDKLKTTGLHIHAGIHDGRTGAVPITHSILFFNKMAVSAGAEVSYSSSEKIGTRDILLSKEAGNLTLTLFEGGHEILVDDVINLLLDYGTRK